MTEAENHTLHRDIHRLVDTLPILCYNAEKAIGGTEDEAALYDYRCRWRWRTGRRVFEQIRCGYHTLLHAESILRSLQEHGLTLVSGKNERESIPVKAIDMDGFSCRAGAGRSAPDAISCLLSDTSRGYRSSARQQAGTR